ncbi:MAG: basic amino acid ABC transporter substrate-binding protein [Acidaminococcaceae bacterium]|nr:basic amino acid ABC transporter substrate-binding protein [Acidaminococcaceae bacterium]MBQ9283882.1 basic amino acid ABC transporter substrate-binding protein [Acidaminococcaceae bacterium]MBQ9320032.1 basic amino acid ABC transporter substrate-binding protein [Acidaminococcaceae bacterium]
MKYAKLFFAVLLGLGILALAGCGGNEKKPEAKPAPKPAVEKVLKIGMDAAYPPFGSQDIKTMEYVGFDVDIIKAIGAEEGFKADIHNLPFDGLIPALKTGNIDVAINDITINEERSQSVDFSKRYYIAGLGVVVKKDNTTIKTAKDLEGKRLGVSIGSTGEEAARKIPNARVKVFNQLNEAFLEAKNNGVDAVINDIPTNEYYANTAGKDDVKTIEVALTKEDLGIAVKKGNKELLAKINSGLAKIKKNGEFTKIYKKWFGKEPPKELLTE